MAIKRKIILYAIAFAVLVLMILFVKRYSGELGAVIRPFLMALIVAYILNPMVIKLEVRKVPRSAAILLIYLVFALVLTTTIIFIIPELVNNTRELITTLPQITKQYQDIFNGVVSIIESSNWSSDIKSNIYKEIQDNSLAAQNYIMDILKRSMTSLLRVISMFFDLALAMIIAYYFIKDAEFFRESALYLTPRRWRTTLVNIVRDINGILSNFIQGQLLTAIIIGTLETIGLAIVRVKYPLILGFVGGVANIIPYFGPIIGAVPAVAIALIESPLKAVWATLVFVIIQQIDNAFISPKIIEGRLGLHPVTTILAVLVGGEFFGIFGMLVAVPVTAILKVIIKRAVEAIV